MTQHQTTYYFDGEGRAFMHECLAHAVGACAQARTDRLVVFTGTGEGPHYVARDLLTRPEYEHLRLVAVTPPFGRFYRVNPGDRESPMVRAGISPEMRHELEKLGVDVVSAHLPFKEMYDGRELTSPWTRVAEAYGALGGGFALCIQAVLVACDAGSVLSGERVVVAAADTAFVVIASRSENFLSPVEGLLVEHIICRPSQYQISKQHHASLARMWGRKPVEQPAPIPAPAFRTEPQRAVLPPMEVNEPGAIPPEVPSDATGRRPRKRAKSPSKQSKR